MFSAGSVSVKIGADLSDFKKDLSGISSSIKAATAEISGIGKAGGLEELSKSSGDAKDDLIALQKAINESAGDFGKLNEKASSTADKFSEAGEAAKKTDVAIRGVDGRLRDTGGRFVSAGKSAGEFSGKLKFLNGGLAKARKGLAAISSQVKIASVAIVAGLAASARSAGQFEESLTRAAGIAKGEGDKLSNIFVSFENAALATAREVDFSAKEMSESLAFLAQAGLSAADGIKALPATAALASAATLDLATSADIVTNVMAGFALKAEELSDTNDVLVGALTSSNVNLQQLGESFKVAGPIAQELGLSIQDTAAAIGLLGNAGIKGSDAGTGLRRALSQLVGASGEARAAMNSLGVNIDVLQKDGLLGLVSSLERARKKLGANEFSGKVFDAFGDRAGPKLLALVSQGTGGVEKLTAAIRRAEETDLTKTLQEEKLATFAGRVRLLSSNFQEFVLILGKAVKDALGPLIKGLTDSFIAFNQNGKAMEVVRDLGQSISNIFALIAGIFGDVNSSSDGASNAVYGFVKSLQVLAKITQNIIVGLRFMVAALTDLGAILNPFDDGGRVKSLNDEVSKLVIQARLAKNALRDAFTVVSGEDTPTFADAFGDGSAEAAQIRLAEDAKVAAAKEKASKEELDRVKAFQEKLKSLNDEVNSVQLSLDTSGLTDADAATKQIEASLINTVAEFKNMAKSGELTGKEFSTLTQQTEALAELKIELINEKESDRIQEIRDGFREAIKQKAAANAINLIQDKDERAIAEIRAEAKSLVDEKRTLVVNGEVSQEDFNNFRAEVAKGAKFKIDAIQSQQVIDAKLKSIDSTADVVSALGLGGVGSLISDSFTDQAEFDPSALIDTGLGVLGSSFSFLAGTVGSVVTSLRPVQDALNALSSLVNGVLSDALSSVGDALAPIIQSVGGIFLSLRPLLDSVARGLVSILQPLGELIGPIGEVISALVDGLVPILDVVGEVLGSLSSSIASVLAPLFSGLAPVLKLLGQTVGLVAQVIGGILGPALELLGNTVGTIINAALEPLAAILEPLSEIFLQVSKALDPILDAFGVLLDALSPLIEIFIQLSPVMLKIKFVAEVLGAVLNALIRPIQKVGEFFGNLGKDIGGALGKVKEFGQKLSDGIRKIFGGKSSQERDSEQRANQQAAADQNIAQRRFDKITERGETVRGVDASDGFSQEEQDKLKAATQNFGDAVAQAIALGIDPAGKSTQQLAQEILEAQKSIARSEQERERASRARRREREASINESASASLSDRISDVQGLGLDFILDGFAAAGGDLEAGFRDTGFGFIEALGIGKSQLEDIFGDGTLGDIDFSELFSQIAGVTDADAGGFSSGAEEFQGRLADILRSFDVFDDQQIGAAVRQFTADFENATAEEKQAFLDKLELEQEQIDEVKARLDEEKNATNALKDISKSLTNVPQGFKLAAARISAIDADQFLPGLDPEEQPLERSASALNVAATSLFDAALAIQSSVFSGPRSPIQTFTPRNQTPPGLLNRPQPIPGVGGGIQVGSVTVVANNPREFMKELDRVSRLESSASLGNPLSTSLINSGR